MNQNPDTELIKRSIDGDGQAFAALIKRVETRLLRLVRSEIADPTYAEDVLQEVLLDVWRGLKQLRDWERWEAWALPDCPTPVLRFLWGSTASRGTDGAQRP